VTSAEKMYGEMSRLVLLYIINQVGLPDNEEFYRIDEMLRDNGYSTREALGFFEYLSAKSDPPTPAPTISAPVDAAP